jgi:hypothetical protein
MGEMYKGFPVVNQYKYLGIIIDDRLGYGPQLNKYTNEINRRICKISSAQHLDSKERF